MMPHGEWFDEMVACSHGYACTGEWFDEMLACSHGYVYTGDDTQHDIKHTRIVPLTMPNGKKKNLHDVLHVPSICPWDRWQNKIYR